jgi:hypothetical protein
MSFDLAAMLPESRNSTPGRPLVYFDPPRRRNHSAVDRPSTTIRRDSSHA